jgi:hypothetical protein
MFCDVATGWRAEVQRSEDELAAECFDVVFVHLFLPPAGCRELDVSLPRTARPCRHHIDGSLSSSRYVRCRKMFIVILRANTTACFDIELQSVLSFLIAHLLVPPFYEWTTYTDGSRAIAFVRPPVQSGFSQFGHKRRYRLRSRPMLRL